MCKIKIISEVCKREGKKYWRNKIGRERNKQERGKGMS
jgi:hypothetical protein